MSDDDISEKTSIVTSDTFRGKLKAATDAPPTIVILMGPQGYVGKQWKIDSADVVIGRSVNSPVFIDDPSVSKTHARISANGNQITIVDLGSTNKTIINNQTLQPMTPYNLKNNDQIKTGNVIFKFLEQGNLEAAAHQELSQKANKDALTGANSKGALLERAPEAMKRAEFLNEDLAILVFDIDHFKKINDNYGHPGGDAVLKELGKIVSTKVVRSQDYFARYGGEEFVILLPGSNEKSAIEVGERVRTTIESAKFEYEGKTIPVTISVGVAIKKNTDTDWGVLFQRADEALYSSKKSGRNKVTAAA